MRQNPRYEEARSPLKGQRREASHQGCAGKRARCRNEAPDFNQHLWNFSFGMQIERASALAARMPLQTTALRDASLLPRFPSSAPDVPTRLTCPRQLESRCESPLLTEPTHASPAAESTHASSTFPAKRPATQGTRGGPPPGASRTQIRPQMRPGRRGRPRRKGLRRSGGKCPPSTEMRLADLKALPSRSRDWSPSKA